MWLPVTLLILAGAVAADNEHAWRTGSEYQYLVRSRTLTGLEQSSNQYSGILIKALLTIQPVDAHTLRAKVSNAQYAHVHKDLPDGWDSQISDRMLQLQDLPISGKPFEIRTKHGVIRDLIVSKETPTWEVNVLKSIVSQLQVDTQGENAVRSRSTQVPEEEEPYAMFKAMEDSVGGKCQVLYDISPLPEYILQHKPELVPKPELKGEGRHIDIVKTKNYSRCEQRMDYHFGIPETANWEPGSNENGKFLSKSTTSRIVISGNLKSFTIQSSVTTNKMFVSPRLYGEQNGVVLSRMNLTLANMNKISNPLPAPNNPESAGNLVYTYNNPFSDNDQRKPGRPNHSQSSKQAVSSSEEVQRNGGKRQKNANSGSSGESSTSISSSEEDTFWQPKPKLDEAPENPLLPFFIGYKGKAIGKSGKIDPVKATKDLVQQIANELDDPSSIPTQETLEKFTILTALIRTMNRNQIAQASEEIRPSPNQLKSNDKSQSKRQNGWAAFRDAVTEAGTGPALMIVKDWIENKKISKFEAAEMVSAIPKKARAPTAEYVQAFFELATNPDVMSEKHLHASAILAFAELVRNSQISERSIHNRYPVHSFGRLSPKRHTVVTEEYIPFLARQLRSSMKDGDGPRTQAYILALGNLGHPKILSVFEPYLEGKEPASTFQRLMMVAAMNRLVELNPKLAHSVLYKIYLNANDAHQVRCTAVYLLMASNPPLNMLQRMAEFTNHDTSKHVSSAVKSSIQSMAKLTRPESQDVANKARAVKGLLTREDFGNEYSKGLITDAVMGNRNLAYQMIINYIGSDDSIIPQAWYVGLEQSYGDFKTPRTELLSIVSSLKALSDLRSSDKSERLESVKSITEKIAEALKIKPEDPTKFEGNFLWNSKYTSRFFAFDEKTYRKEMPNMILKYWESLKNGAYGNMNSLASYDVTLSFPTETGFPFMYTLKVPTLHKVSGTAKGQVTRDGNINAESEFRMVYSLKVQGRVGFVTPFEHQSFISGVDMNFQAYAPAKIQADVNPLKNSIELKLWPMKGEKNARLLHYSVVPYTSKHDILNLQPVLSDKNTHKCISGEVTTISDSFPSRNLKVFKLDMEADDGNEQSSEETESEELFGQLVFPWAQKNRNSYGKIDVSMNMEQEQEEPVIFTGVFDSNQEGSESSNSQDWEQKAKAIEPSNKQPNSEARRKQFLKEAAKGINSARSNVVDLRLEIPGQYRNRNSLTLAWATSNVEEKARSLLYLHSDLPNQEVNYEICSAGQIDSKPNPRLNYENAIKTKPSGEFNVDVRYGNTCFDDGQINVSGKLKQTEDFREHMQRSLTVKKCLEQMKQGNKALKSCQKASSIAMTLNEMNVSVQFHSTPMKMLANEIVNVVKDMVPTGVEVDATDPKNAEKDSIDINVKLSKDLSKANVNVHTSVMDVSIPDIRVADMGTQGTEILATNDNMDIRSIDDDQHRPVCVLDANQAETFDDRSYPLNLGKCWHVAMTTYPQKNAEQPNEIQRIPEEKRVSIVTRENEDGQKEVKINLGEKEVRLSSSGSQLQATVNGQKVRQSQQMSYQERDEDQVVFEIFELQDGSIRLMSDKYDVDAIFDGKRIQIQASDKYRSSVRGLCGNFDGNADNDFTSPKNRILKKPEEFLASYALTNEECEGPSQENARRADKFLYTRPTNRMSNVISDYEAGRFNSGNRKWGYHSEDQPDGKRCNTYRTKVSTVNDKLCFTMRPVPSCASGCSATEMKTKNYQFHCMQNGPAAQEMKKRVEKGANPDLSQKTPSLTQPIEIPLACRA